VFDPHHSALRDRRAVPNAFRPDAVSRNTTFEEWSARRDRGILLPGRRPIKGLPRINATPFVDQHGHSAAAAGMTTVSR